MTQQNLQYNMASAIKTTFQASVNAKTQPNLSGQGATPKGEFARVFSSIQSAATTSKASSQAHASTQVSNNPTMHSGNKDDMPVKLVVELPDGERFTIPATISKQTAEELGIQNLDTDAGAVPMLMVRLPEDASSSQENILYALMEALYESRAENAEKSAGSSHNSMLSMFMNHSPRPGAMLRIAHPGHNMQFDESLQYGEELWSFRMTMHQLRISFEGSGEVPVDVQGLPEDGVTLMAAVVQVSGDSLNNQASAGVESSTGTSTTFYQESHFRAMHTVNAEGTQQSSGSMATGVSRENSIPAEAVPIDGNPLITGKEGEAAGTASSMISGAETTASAGALTGVAANDASTMSTTADASKQTAASPGSQQTAASPGSQQAAASSGSQQAAASSGSQQAAASSGSQQAADKTLVDAAQMARDSADETQVVKTSGNTAESAAAKQNGAAAGAAGKESSIPFKPVMDNAESSDTKVLNDNRNTDSVIPERTRIDTVLSKNTDTSASAGKSPAQKAVEYALGGGEEVSQPYNANTVESAGNTSQGRQTQVVSENGIPVEIAHEQAESEMSGGGNKDSQTADDLPDDVAARLFTGEVDTKNGTDNVFAEKMKMAASPKTEDRMIQSMVREAKFMVEEGLSKADITLDPPDLGKMKIEIVTENSKVTAKLTVESREVQDLVQDNLRQLQEQFAEQGMKIESFDVQVGHNGGSDAWANRERAEQSGITGNGHKTRRPGAIADSEAGIENDSSHRATRSLTSEQLDMLA